MADEQRATQVVIVGAGPAGLAAAIELGQRGIACRLIERNERAGYAPRAKTTHTRTREHLRRWGIADKLAEASPFGVDFPSNVVYVTRLAGHEIARFPNALQNDPTRNELYSEHAQWIPQYKLEGVLRAHVETLPSVELVFGEEFVSFEQTSGGISVRVRSVAGGSETLVSAQYLIGADGARSRVRDAIGAKMEGVYGLSRNYNTIFRAPGLREANPHGDGIMFVQVNDDAPSLIGPMDEGDLWYFMPTRIEAGRRFTSEEILGMIRRSTGIDLSYEVLSSDEWVASRLLADRYSLGRAFLIGDACHLHPPYGGYGMNMGVADAVDIGWKIAAVLQGWGGRTLLDSYEAERRLAHEFVMDEAEANHASSPNQLYREGLEEPGPEGDRVRAEVGEEVIATKTAEFMSLGVVLGIRYQDSPVVIDDGSPRWTPERDYHPSAEPGSLAPHHWLGDGSSLYDHFGPGFTLLALDGADEADVARAVREAEATGTPLAVARFDDPALDALYQAPLALIRPDQHIAWRGSRWPSDGSVFAHVTGRAEAPVEAVAA